jgi:hypothetical protein
MYSYTGVAEVDRKVKAKKGNKLSGIQRSREVDLLTSWAGASLRSLEIDTVTCMVCVTIDGVWIGEWIYKSFIHTIRKYK